MGWCISFKIDFFHRRDAHRRCLWRFCCHVENFSHHILSRGEILHMTDCHVEKALHMRKSVMWRNDVYNLWCFVSLNCCKILFWRFTLFCGDFFVAIYALLCGEKIKPKNVSAEKKERQISCMFFESKHHKEVRYPQLRLQLWCVIFCSDFAITMQDQSSNLLHWFFCSYGMQVRRLRSLYILHLQSLEKALVVDGCQSETLQKGGGMLLLTSICHLLLGCTSFAFADSHADYKGCCEYKRVPGQCIRMPDAGFILGE